MREHTINRIGDRIVSIAQPRVRSIKRGKANASDKVINTKVLSSISKYMAENSIKKEGFIYIADSAMVTRKNLEKIGDGIQTST